MMGYATPEAFTPDRAAHTPKSLGLESKNFVIKVQVPFDSKKYGPAEGDGDLFIYTKKRQFACVVKRTDNPSGYDRISKVV